MSYWIKPNAWINKTLDWTKLNNRLNKTLHILFERKINQKFQLELDIQFLKNANNQNTKQWIKYKITINSE